MNKIRLIPKIHKLVLLRHG